MKNIRVKKLFNGFASVRDYIVRECRFKGEGLKIHYTDKTMTIPFETLRNYNFHLHAKKIKSKYTGEYRLIDFKWRPDNQKDNQIYILNGKPTS